MKHGKVNLQKSGKKQHGHLFHCLKTKMSWAQNGFFKSSTKLMALQIGLKLGLWHRDFPNNMVLTTMKFFFI